VHEDYKAVGPYSNSKEMEALAYANWSDYMRLDPSTLPFSEDLQAYYVASSSAPAPASGSASVSAGDGVGADVKEAEGEGKTAALGPPLGPPSGPPLAVDPLAGDRQQLPVLMRLTTRGRDEELSLINSEYRAGLERLQDELDRDGILKPMDGLKAQHYYGRTAGESKESGARYKKVIREITRELYDKLSVESRGTMLIRFDADAPQFLRAVITGMDGTPYASGCFVFDIHVPPEYPEVSPKVIHVTPRSDIDSLKAPHSPGGFSPNLHRQGGKVCLSLLGTWDGPGWVSGQSNLYMVLAALQLQIFGAEHPYYMEPNYG
jgi:ubiquitin-protein ligase